jgi:hypothetical protein
VVLATHQRGMKRQECRRAYSDGELSDASGTEEERPESAEEPVASRQAGRPPATTTKHDELLLEYEILGDHRSHATGATQLRGHNGEVEQGEQEVLHAPVSVGQTPGGTQRCPIREPAREWAIRDPQSRRVSGIRSTLHPQYAFVMQVMHYQTSQTDDVVKRGCVLICDHVGSYDAGSSWTGKVFWCERWYEHPTATHTQNLRSPRA